jgi:serine/threonine-protein kinase SRK2
MRLRACLPQSVEEVKRLIEESRKVGPLGPGAPGNVETDEYIDDAMDNMYDEGSLDYNES